MQSHVTRLLMLLQRPLQGVLVPRSNGNCLHRKPRPDQKERDREADDAELLEPGIGGVPPMKVGVGDGRQAEEPDEPRPANPRFALGNGRGSERERHNPEGARQLHRGADGQRQRTELGRRAHHRTGVVNGQIRPQANVWRQLFFFFPLNDNHHSR